MWDTLLSRCTLDLLLTLRADVKYHPFALEVRYIIGLAVLGEVGSEACEEEFTLFLEDDGASAEEDIGFHFVALFEELDGMLELEVIVMIVGLGTETDLFDFLLLGIRFRLFLFFLLSVEEFLIVHYPAYGRIRRSSDLDEVEVLVIGNFHCLLERVDTLLYIVANKAHLSHTADLVIDTMRIFLDNTTATRSGSNRCYIRSYYMVNNTLIRACTLCPTIEKACKVTTFF